jgi:hypothetical protein
MGPFVAHLNFLHSLTGLGRDRRDNESNESGLFGFAFCEDKSE